MTGIRWRASATLTLLAILALCVGTQNVETLSAKDNPRPGRTARPGGRGQNAAGKPGDSPRGTRPDGSGATGRAPGPANGPNSDFVKKVVDIQNRNHAALVAQKGIAATATGLDEDGNVVIKVYTTGADSPKIPKQLENVPVLEVLTGPLHLLQAPAPLRQSRLPRACPIGSSAFDDVDPTAGLCATGTLGCRLHDNHGNIFALSNNHVFAGENLTEAGIQLGTLIVQPGSLDNNCIFGITSDQLGPLVAFVPVLPEVVPVGVRSFDTTLLSRKMNESGERPPLSAATSNGNSRTCRSLTLS